MFGRLTCQNLCANQSHTISRLPRCPAHWNSVTKRRIVALACVCCTSQEIRSPMPVGTFPLLDAEPPAQLCADLSSFSTNMRFPQTPLRIVRFVNLCGRKTRELDV